MESIFFNFGWERTLGRLLPWEKGKNAVKVNLPDDFVLNLPRRPEAVGGTQVGFAGNDFGVYTKTFDYDEAWRGKKVFLNLDGAYMCAEITLNKDRIGMHPYGYTPYTVDITDALRDDLPNILEITTQTMQPSTRWYSGGGLYRNVHLWVGGPIYLLPGNLFITTPHANAKQGVVCVEAEITNTLSESRPVTLKAVLSYEGEVVAEEACRLIAKAEDCSKATVTIAVDNPKLWDDVTPNLYDIEVIMEADGQEPDITRRKVGIRTFTVSAKDGLAINGRKLKLYGGCIHHDNGLLGSRALPRAEERKIRNLKAAGFNAIRTAHNPPSDALLDACDKLGVYVLDEFFDCWRIGKNQNDYHLFFTDWWKRDIEYTIRRDRNHPSVYAWSFGNEIQEANGNSDCEYWVKAQADHIRSLDPTRFVTNGGMFLPKNLTCDGMPGGPYAPPMPDDPYEIKEVVNRRWANMISQLDIVSMNYSFRNYEQFHKLFPDKPLQGTETQGIDAWGNKEAVRNNDHVIGDFMWTAHDNLGEAGAGRSYWDEAEAATGLMAKWPWLSCYQGDLALDGERLPRSYYRKVIWGKDDGIYLFTTHPEHAGEKVMGTSFHWHDVRPLWTYPEEYVGKPVDVEAYCDCDTVRFYVNDALKAEAEPKEMIFYATVPYEPGTLKAVAYRKGEPVAETCIETTGHAVRICLTEDDTVLKADGMEIAYVTATLVDEQGRRVYDEDLELAADVSGAAVLEGFGSNNPCTEENFGTGCRVTWNGKATLVLRAGLEPGEVTLRVTASGLPEAFITKEVHPT